MSSTTISSLWLQAVAGHTTGNFIVEMGLASSLCLVPPNRDQLLGVQHHVMPVSPLVWVFHCSLIDTALHGSMVAGVLAGGDLHRVAAASHPSHVLDDMERSCGRGRIHPRISEDIKGR